MIAVQLFFLAKENLCDLTIGNLCPALVSPDSNDLFDGGNEDLTIPDLPSLGRLKNRLDNLLSHIVRGENFQFYFRQKIDRVFGATVKLGMAFLASKPLYLGDRHAGNTGGSEFLFYFVKLEGFYDRFDFFHCSPFSLSWGRGHPMPSDHG